MGCLLTLLNCHFVFIVQSSQLAARVVTNDLLTYLSYWRGGRRQWLADVCVEKDDVTVLASNETEQMTNSDKYMN